MTEFLILSLAVYRLTRLFLRDTVLNPLRDRFWEKHPPETTRLGYLSTCPWCLGFWLSLAVYSCYTILPVPTLWLCCVLAVSAVVGLLTALEDRL